MKVCNGTRLNLQRFTGRFECLVRGVTATQSGNGGWESRSRWDGRGGTTRAHTGYGVRDQIIDVPRADKNMDDEEISPTAAARGRNLQASSSA